MFPDNAQTHSYDDDGNLTSDGVWTYVWDAENRLKSMTMSAVSGIPNAQRKKLEFTYDHLGRRATKKVSTWNGSSFSSAVTTKLVYDGWNLIAELDSSNNVLRSYVWGQDLSGTMDGAGGVGGLLIVRDHGTGDYHFVGYDGNGNVTCLADASDQSVSARYEYSPFGELIRSSGDFAEDNPFRWSSKFWDEESGLVYYGYRYYSPSLGRWINRDPIEEEGGVNLYLFTRNNPIKLIDALGMYEDDWELDMRLEIAAEFSGFVATYAYDRDTMDRHMEQMAQAREEVTEIGVDIAMAVGLPAGTGMAGRLVGKAFGRVAKAATRVATDKHHGLPRFLGGFDKQLLTKLDRGVHQELHSILRENLKKAGLPSDGPGWTIGNWAQYLSAPGKQRQQKAFNAVLDASRAIDAKYGTTVTQDVWMNIMLGKFTPLP